MPEQLTAQTQQATLSYLHSEHVSVRGNPTSALVLLNFKPKGGRFLHVRDGFVNGLALRPAPLQSRNANGYGRAYSQAPETSTIGRKSIRSLENSIPRVSARIR